MRLDTDRLKALYREYVRQKTPASLDGCPSPERLLRLLRARSPDKEVTELVDHISRCRFCFSEFGFVLDILRQEKEFVRELENRQSAGGGPGPRKGLRRRIFEWRLGWRPLVPRFSWHAAAILAGVVLAGFLIGKYAVFRPAEAYRGPATLGVELLEPNGDEVSVRDLVFRWKKTADAESYTLELFDQALERVWKSGRLTGESVSLPRDLAATLGKGRPYFWEVTAHLRHGQQTSSPLQRFTLKD
jgi:hypothetical protein